jgi:hypothetical protein
VAKLQLVDPLQILAMRYGYTRPLDRHDFPHGHIPDSVSRVVPGLGELVRHANLTGIPMGGVDIHTGDYSSTQKLPLGTLARTKDGRLFRYASVGATALVAGSIYQRAAPIANHLANTPPAVAVGATEFTYTPGATAGAANLYAEGFLQVDTAPGNGYAYRISGHGAISASTAFTLYLDKDDPIQVALTTSSRVGLHHNLYKNVIVCPTTLTGPVVGGAVSIAPADYFGWLQTRGPFPALINGTPGVGIGVVISATTAGAVDVAAVAAEINVRIIGHMMQVGVSTKNNMINLMLD